MSPGHILTDREIKDILNDPNPPTLLGFGNYVYAHKVDLYSFYLEQKFNNIDTKYYQARQRNTNKGKKGELLLCGIIDLAMWGFGFRLGQDYTVIHDYPYKKVNSIDFKLTCHDTVFLCEAKNWYETTYVDQQTYEKKIKTRFFTAGINILMILKDKIPDVENMYQQYSTDNSQPINYIGIDDFMNAGSNNVDDINRNLLFGTNQLISHIIKNTELFRDFSITKCLQMNMPTWFIANYLDISEKTVNRHARSMGLNRRSSEYRSLVKYRRIY
jgi:hypothetical protein